MDEHEITQRLAILEKDVARNREESVERHRRVQTLEGKIDEIGKDVHAMKIAQESQRRFLVPVLSTITASTILAAATIIVKLMASAGH